MKTLYSFWILRLEEFCLLVDFGMLPPATFAVDRRDAVAYRSAIFYATPIDLTYRIKKVTELLQLTFPAPWSSP